MLISEILYCITRLLFKQKIFCGDMILNHDKLLSVIVPTKDNESDIGYTLESILESNYDSRSLEIIVVDYDSKDETRKVIREYKKNNKNIKTIFYEDKLRGESKEDIDESLEPIIDIAASDNIVIIRAGSRIGKNVLKQFMIAFEDSYVGICTGREMALNGGENILTRLLNLNMSGFYQSCIQGESNINRLILNSGNVIGIRKKIAKEHDLNCFNYRDDLSFIYSTYISGWKVEYINSAESMVEVEKDWKAYSKRIREKATSQNKSMFKYFFKTVISTKISFAEKLDVLMKLLSGIVPLLYMMGVMCFIALFFTCNLGSFSLMFAFSSFSLMLSYGVIPSIFYVCSSQVIEGNTKEIYLYSLNIIYIFFVGWNYIMGLKDAIIGEFGKNWT